MFQMPDFKKLSDDANYLLKLLERIAIALEKIAERMPGRGEEW